MAQIGNTNDFLQILSNCHKAAQNPTYSMEQRPQWWSPEAVLISAGQWSTGEWMALHLYIELFLNLSLQRVVSVYYRSNV